MGLAEVELWQATIRSSSTAPESDEAESVSLRMRKCAALCARLGQSGAAARLLRLSAEHADDATDAALESDDASRALLADGPKQGLELGLGQARVERQALYRAVSGLQSNESRVHLDMWGVLFEPLSISQVKVSHVKGSDLSESRRSPRAVRTVKGKTVEHH